MNADETARAANEEELAARLAAYDEALKAGAASEPAPLSEGAPTVLQGEWGRARACLRLLEQAWPRRPGVAPPPAQADPLPPGAVVGHYRILERRGDGGMGVVYKAHDLQMNRPVALKFLKADRAADPMFLLRFQREARAASALNHPNLCTIHAAGDNAGQPYLVMEWVEGHSLAQHFAGKPLPGAAAAALLLPLARAVAYAHSQGIVHRDLKPANVLIADLRAQTADLKTEPSSPKSAIGILQSSVLKIVDFGLAKQLEGDQAQTQSGDVLGTPSYMAPEQASGRNENVGPSADIYSLGVILYELLTGRPPFLGSSVLETLLQVRNLDPVPPSRLQPHVPRDLETICLKCLRKQPTDRYHTAEALAADLERFQAGQPIMARPVSTVERGAKWVRRRPAVAGLLALVLLLTTMVMGMVLWQWRSAETALDEAHRLRRERALAQVNSLRVVVPGAVPSILADLQDNRADVLPRVRELWAKDDDEAKRMRSGLALLPVEPDLVRDDLVAWMLKTEDPAEVLLVRDELLAHDAQPHAEDLKERLWSKALDPGGAQAQRLRALVALAAFDPSGQGWARAAEAAARLLLAANPFYQGQWTNALKPVGGVLLVPLSEAFHAAKKPEERLAAALVLADYAADDPDRLADLLLDADPRQYAVLLPVLAKHRGKAIERMRHELAATAVKWGDAPLNPAWAEPTAALVQEVEQADGLFHERFALCQSLPLERLAAVAESLRSCGFRPVRVRPWQHGAAICVAVVWTRDGRDFCLDVDRSAEQVKADERERAKTGFVPADVAGYGDRYTALWVKATARDRTELFVGSTPELVNENALNTQPGHYVALTGSATVGPDGRLYFTSIWRNNPQPSAINFSMREPDLEYALCDGTLLPADVQIHAARPAASQAMLALTQLSKADKELATRPATIFALWQRADALEKLGRDDEALVTFDKLAAMSSNVPADSNRLRALVNARLGRGEAACSHLAAYRKLETRQDQGFEALVCAWLGNETAALERLEEALRREPHNRDLLVNAASIFGRCGTIVAQRNARLATAAVGMGPPLGLGSVVPLAELAAHEDRPARYTRRGLALMQQAVDNGWRNVYWMSIQTDLPPLQDQPEFKEFFRHAHLDRQYCLARQELPGLEAAESHGLDLAGHLARCRELAAQGYRPAALSAFATDGGVATASVWHRPKAALHEQEALARRHGHAAATLLHLGDDDQAWPLFRHRSQPETRSQLVWRVSQLAVDPAKLVDRLEAEPDLSARRALIVALGDYAEEQLPPPLREPITRKLLEWYRNDPDPGIHGAIDWLLRQDKEGPEPRALVWGQAKKLEKIDAELQRRDPDGRRRWYVNGQGQTLVLVPGPVEFPMGSPPDEPGRINNERLHQRRIERSFAIASKSVTVAQYQRYLKDWPQEALASANIHSKDADCPINVLSWYAAARYCNWLSEKEGIPKDQWCYPEHVQIAEGMKPYPDYLKRTGYRLPTEAEWEYACRAGAVSCRYYGSSLELLPRYSWWQQNAEDRTWPVGQKRPNDLGLFDLYGNLNTWVQNPLVSYRPSSPVKDEEWERAMENTEILVVRGGSFGNLAASARSAARSFARPNDQSFYLGLRVARTCR